MKSPQDFLAGGMASGCLDGKAGSIQVRECLGGMPNRETVLTKKIKVSRSSHPNTTSSKFHQPRQ